MPYSSIRYSDEIQKKCRTALRKIFPNNSFQLHASRKSGRRGSSDRGTPFDIQIQRSGATKDWTDPNHGTTYVLAPITDSELRDQKYWFALKLDFIPGPGDHVLRQASILIFSGDATPQPFVRAEWDNGEPDGKHAQPHWHIYGSNMDRVAPVFPSPNTREHPAPRTERIHYAMSATWRLGDKPAKAHWKSIETTDALANWVGGCLQYLVTQLIYFESMAPARAAGPHQFGFRV